MAVAGVACGDFTGVPASLPTVSRHGAVYAINGAPPARRPRSTSSAATLLRGDASFVFDIAFDIDARGRILILLRNASSRPA